ncbi:MAG TPA: ABC transporter permease [Verrucomicrobiae bacterium]|jgi:rhamnose transport system permease protein|nr:ABC transporter permease [Verrucomicrobiae bacterium]
MNADKNGWKKILLRHETILFVVLVVEWLLFYHFGTSVNRRGMTVGFGTLDRQFDILRHSCEIGLLALALTPVILTGGIDLSVGSLLGLSAIMFGKLWHDVGLSIPVAATCALVIGAIGGGLNATLITTLRIPPLIVTLGTYSLFRGLAEAITRGAVTYTDFPDSFLFIGQERWMGLPTQTWLFILVAIFIGLLVHRTTFGRSFRAIGFAPEGTRYAGIPVNRRIALVYILAGIISALAAIIYTARLGQAKADAGTGYELFAITAVVLGGTSIFGGIGSVPGTLLGVAAIAVLKNGLASLPIVIRMNSAEELSGMMTGALLLFALCSGVLPKFLSKWRTSRHTVPKQPQPISA